VQIEENQKAAPPNPVDVVEIREMRIATTTRALHSRGLFPKALSKVEMLYHSYRSTALSPTIQKTFKKV
jgi:hypothetical protein